MNNLFVPLPALPVFGDCEK